LRAIYAFNSFASSFCFYILILVNEVKILRVILIIAIKLINKHHLNYKNTLKFKMDKKSSNQSKLQDYEILNKLGQGSFGVVYKVKRKSKYYVVKYYDKRL